jgi:hypothetical protein
MKKLRAVRDRVRNLWIDRLWSDLAIVAVIVLIHAILVVVLPVTDILGNALASDRRATYSAAAVVVSLLGSLSSVAISQLGSAKGARATALKTQAAETLARNWRSIFRSGMLSAVLAIVALLMDPSRVTSGVMPVVVRWVFEAGVIFALVKFMRLSALFYEVITLTARSAGEDEERPAISAPVPVGKWRNAS